MRRDTMKREQRLWWVLFGAFLLLCTSFVGMAYRFGWSATGFLQKSLWDWLQLLIMPLVLAIIVLLFQLSNTRTERQMTKQRYEHDQQMTKQRYKHDQKIALEKQQEDLLQTYLDRLSELLLKDHLRPALSEQVRKIARVRTITVLARLDVRRVEYAFSFLWETGL